MPLHFLARNKMKSYNYNSLVNLSNSILKHFGVEPFHETIPEIDEVLKGHKKVVAVLFDGMGQNIVRKHLDEKSFIRTHYLTTINSTLPPTTAAATTAFLTGKYPIETGWIGWDTYFKDYDRNIILFRSVDYNTGEKLIKDGEQDIADKYYPTTKLFELIKNANKNAKTFCIQRHPIQKDGPKTLLWQGVRQVTKAMRSCDEGFAYFYWDSPDGEMHENGIDHWKVKYQVRKAQRFMKKVAKKNPDTLFILFADHGHINFKAFDICEHADLYSLIKRPLSMEKRFASIYVKEGKQAEFAELFNKYYGNYFELISKEEALKSKIFGEGEPAPGVIDSFGDFLAVSIKEYGIYDSVATIHYGKPFKGHHAGGTEEERLIDISVFNSEK